MMFFNPGAGFMGLDDPSASAGDDDLAAWLGQITGSGIDREALCHSTGADGQTYAEKTRKAALDVLIAVGDSTEEYVSQFVKFNFQSQAKKWGFFVPHAKILRLS